METCKSCLDFGTRLVRSCGFARAKSCIIGVEHFCDFSGLFGLMFSVYFYMCVIESGEHDLYIYKFYFYSFRISIFLFSYFFL